MDNFLTAFQAIVLTITFIAILWYTIETSRLRKVNFEQLQLSKKPVLTFYLERLPENYEMDLGCKFFIKNIGLGGATNIEIENKNFEIEYEKKTFTPTFKTNNTVRPNEEIQLKVYISIAGQEKRPGYKEINIPKGQYNKSREVTLRYHNLFGEKFSTQLEVSETKTKILKIA